MQVVELSSGSIPVRYASAVMAALGHQVVAFEFEGPDSEAAVAGIHSENVATLHTSRGVSRRVLSSHRMKEFEEYLLSGRPDSGLAESAEIRSGDVLLTDAEGIAVAASGGGLSVVSVTPFGLGSPRTRWRLSGPSLFHLGGLGIVTPRAAYHGEPHDGPPQAPFGSPLEYLVALYASFAALAAAGATKAIFADISLLDCLLPLTRRETAAWQFEAYRATRKQRLWKVGPSGFYVCADGYFYLHVVEDRQWRELCSLIGGEQFENDPRFATSLSRFENESAVDEVLAPWALHRTRREIFEILGSSGIPCGPAFTAAEARRFSELINPQVKSDAGVPWVAPLPIRVIGGEQSWLGRARVDESPGRIDG